MPDSPSDKIQKRHRSRTNWLGFGALAVLAMLLAAMILNGRRSASEREATERWHLHTFEVLLQVEAVKTNVNSAIRGERGYIITGNDKFLDPFVESRAASPDLIAGLRRETADNPVQQRNVDAIERSAKTLFATLERAIALRRAGRIDAVRAFVSEGRGRAVFEAALDAIGMFEREERRLLGERARANAIANEVTTRNDLTIAMAGLVLLALAAAAGMSAMRAQRRAAEAYARLRHSAATDELTGLANRRAFMAALETEVARAGRSGAPLSVAIVDLDHFKRINDTHGHAGGDAVLRGFADVARETMRAGDVVARVGGEEFAVLMPDTGEKDAARACERLREAVAEARFAVPDGEPIAATLSSGVALLVPGEARDRLVTRADRALYRAKQEGRNQVRLAA